MIKFFLKRLFCKHLWVKIAWHEEFDRVRNMRYSMRTYMCVECGKFKTVDGRNDTILYPKRGNK